MLSRSLHAVFFPLWKNVLVVSHLVRARKNGKAQQTSSTRFFWISWTKRPSPDLFGRVKTLSESWVPYWTPVPSESETLQLWMYETMLRQLQVKPIWFVMYSSVLLLGDCLYSHWPLTAYACPLEMNWMNNSCFTSKYFRNPKAPNIDVLLKARSYTIM